LIYCKLQMVYCNLQFLNSQSSMENFFLKRIISKPPVFFPWVALFHFFILAYSIWSYAEFPFPSEYWIPSLWLLVYTTCWLFLCDLKRWAAWLYGGLTILNICLHYALKYQSDIAIYTPPFLVLYILFSVLVLLYYKKLE